jgi:hypothetical protein
MAITIESSPQDFTTMGNPITFVLSSTNVAQPNFKYVADVSFNGNLVARLKATPNPTNDYGYFNIREVLRYFITIDTGIDEGRGFLCPNMWGSYTVEFSEEYTGAAATTYDFTGTLYCGAIDSLSFPQYDFNDYVVSSTPSIHRLLTNRPQSVTAIAQNLAYMQSGYLYVPCTIETVANIDYVRYRYYDRGGSIIREFYFKTKNFGYHNASDPNETSVITVPFMPAEVFIIPGGYTSDSNSGDVDFPFDEGYYSLTLSKAANDLQLQSDEYFVYLNTDCQRYDLTEVHFQNQLGGVDSYVFNKPNRERQNITRIEASKPLLTMGETYSYTQSSFSRYNASVDYSKEFTVMSDWLTDDEFEWLSEMVRSPRLWVKMVVDVSGTPTPMLVPILVTDTSYNVWKRDFDLLHTLTMTYKYTFDEAMPL